MKSKFLSLFMCATFPMLLSATQPAVNEDRIPYDLHPEHDKTDIFAIPVDMSEEEEEQEEEELEELQKYEQSKKN